MLRSIVRTGQRVVPRQAWAVQRRGLAHPIREAAETSKANVGPIREAKSEIQIAADNIYEVRTRPDRLLAEPSVDGSPDTLASLC